MNGSPLEQIEEITRAMQETAAREDWDHLAEQEHLRIALVRAIDPNEARTPARQAILTRIVQDNERLVKRLSERKADIARLLDGLASKPAPDR